MMRLLTDEEIAVLENNGCSADNWENITVADEFTPYFIKDVAFHGEVSLGVFEKTMEVAEGLSLHTGIRHATLCDVAVGDNCLIENISGYICRYHIGDETYISGVGQMASIAGANYGKGNVLSVLNEAGDGNIVMYDGLTSQMAALMVRVAKEGQAWQALRKMALEQASQHIPSQGIIGSRAKIVNTTEVVNTLVGDGCEVSGAARLVDCTLAGSLEAGCFVGHDVILENVIVSAGSSVVDGAKIYNCFVGEACHLGKGYSAENCVFFANSYLDNGEACAAFCGPFTVSHHKASLLIGGEYSFYNAGSATNFSNHAYKLGPIHYGVLERGSKTASGAHLLMPANIGAFSVCLGKIQQHPDTRQLPFSYIIGEAHTTSIVPGRNLMTVGTYRDVAKWPKRDKRPVRDRYAVGGFEGDYQSIINFDWLNPLTAREIVNGLQLLNKLVEEQGDNQTEYTFGDCIIRRSSLLKGIQYYRLALQLYVGQAARNHYGELPESTIGTGEWADLAGMLLPESEIDSLCSDISDGLLTEIAEMEERFASIHQQYEQYKWNGTYRLILDYLGVDLLTEEDLQRISNDYDMARRQWLNAVKLDAEREFALGDVEESELAAFLAKIESEINRNS